jgi:hypothetical protein
MSDHTHSWCHGPYCHEKRTQDRVRGVKGNKVLRTRRVRWYQSDYESKWNYFCGQRCMTDYIDEHLQAFVRIAPRREPLETRCEVTTTKQQGKKYDWETRDYVDHTYTEKTIRVDINDI